MEIVYLLIGVVVATILIYYMDMRADRQRHKLEKELRQERSKRERERQREHVAAKDVVELVGQTMERVTSTIGQSIAASMGFGQQNNNGPGVTEPGIDYSDGTMPVEDERPFVPDVELDGFFVEPGLPEEKGEGDGWLGSAGQDKEPAQ